MLTIYILDSRLHHFVPDKVISACQKMKIDSVYFSDFAFCPYLYSYKDVSKDIVYVGNVNVGSVNSKKEDSDYNVVEFDSLEDFIRAVFSIKFGIVAEETTNALF